MNAIEADVTIIGAGLTGLTAAYYLNRSGINVLLVEKESYTGGVIRTLHEQGFIFEAGPNSGIIGTTEIVKLFDDLKDKVKPETANPKAGFRWIWKGGKWNPLPSGIISAINTPLFSPADKFRILGEPFRKPGNNKNETVSQMVRRRLGTSFLNYAVDPFISGIYAGDPDNLIARFALPKLYNLEQTYGSFILGAIRKRKQLKTGIEKKVTREVFSVTEGLGNLVNALTGEIDSHRIHTGCSDVQVSQANSGFVTNYVDGQGRQVRIESGKIISAIGGNNLMEVFPFFPGNEMHALTNTPYARVIQVIACYKRWEGLPLNAFGGLIPSKENRSCLGILFTSSLFTGRAPVGGAILSVFIGGIKKPEMFDKTDSEIRNLALTEIKETLQGKHEPDLLRIFRYRHAIPQYDLGTEARLKAIHSVQEKYPGLYLAGNIRDGIGMADRVKQGRNIADHIINRVPGNTEDAKI